jgi:hypothetical protein
MNKKGKKKSIGTETKEHITSLKKYTIVVLNIAQRGISVLKSTL